MPNTTTLRRQLLVRLLPPLLVIWAISSLFIYRFAVHYVTLGYDHSLFDTALDIAQQLRDEQGRLSFELPSAVSSILEQDGEDHIYYAIVAADGKPVFGRRDLPLPPREVGLNKVFYYDALYRQEQVRVAAAALSVGKTKGPTVMVIVAETLKKRRHLVTDILFSIGLLQLLQIALSGLLVWYGVQRGLGPLNVLSAEISQRSAQDLRALPEQEVVQEIKPLVHAMNGLFARLQMALEGQRRFIANASHQLRTPLAGLQTQVELALRHPDPNDLDQTLQQMHSAITRATHLANQLLTLARAEPETEQSLRLQPLDLAELARQVTAEFVDAALAKDIDLGLESASSSLQVQGDRVLLRELLRNLLDNAIRYIPPGGQVTVRLAPVQDALELSVEDDGPGIAPELRKRVFERFYRIPDTTLEGCGLGLAIVREIAARHQAELRLEAGANGRGTCISLRFPPLAPPA